MRKPKKTKKSEPTEVTKLRAALEDAKSRLESEQRSHKVTKLRLTEEGKSHAETKKLHAEDRSNFKMHLTALNAVAAAVQKPSLDGMTQWMIGDLESLRHTNDVDATTKIADVFGPTDDFQQDINAKWFNNQGVFAPPAAGQSVARYAFYILGCMP